jgi:hypothetical protein
VTIRTPEEIGRPRIAQPRVTQSLQRVVAYTTRTFYTWHFQDQPIPVALKIVMAFVYGCDQWAWIVAVAGFAYRYLLTADGPWRRYLTEAISPTTSSTRPRSWCSRTSSRGCAGRCWSRFRWSLC